jgi:hypothetical protein
MLLHARYAQHNGVALKDIGLRALVGSHAGRQVRVWHHLLERKRVGFVPIEMETIVVPTAGNRREPAEPEVA